MAAVVRPRREGRQASRGCVLHQGSEMRVLLAVVVTLGISIGAAAQTAPKPYKPRPTDADAAPKSMPAVRGPGTTGATAAGTTSKQLQAVERQTPKGKMHTGQKAPKPVAVQTEKDRNPPMNFGKGSGSSVGMTKQNSAYKGRLKQKGASNSH